MLRSRPLPCRICWLEIGDITTLLCFGGTFCSEWRPSKAPRIAFSRGGSNSRIRSRVLCRIHQIRVSRLSNTTVRDFSGKYPAWIVGDKKYIYTEDAFSHGRTRSRISQLSTASYVCLNSARYIDSEPPIRTSTVAPNRPPACTSDIDRRIEVG